MPKRDYVVKQPAPENFKPFPDCWFETRQATLGGYLPEALAKGVYQLAPPPLVVNNEGLEGIQAAVDVMRVLSENGLDAIKEVVYSMKGGVKGNEMTPIKLVVERP
jgi:hypothetical protein